MHAIFLTCLILIAAALPAADPLPRGSRILAIDVNMSATGTYDDAFAFANVGCGVQNVGISIDWSTIETTPSVFTDPSGNLAIMDFYYPAAGKSITLTLRPLHTNLKPVPSDLTGTTFSSPQMATRFCAMLDWTLAQIPNVQLEALVVGSEFDIYLGSNATLWSDWAIFFDAVATHVRTNHPGLRLATEATFDGFISHPTELAAINTDCDVIGVSYYAIGSGFAVKSLATLQTDLTALVAHASPGKPLCFYQFGCPSDALLGSSEAIQAQFIDATFTFWDQHSTLIGLIDFTWLHELSPAAVTNYQTYYGLVDPNFAAFLGSLGLRNWAGAGSDKQSFLALRHAARARGWGNAIPVATALTRTTTASTALSVTLSATDGDGDTLTYSVVTAPAHGALSGTAPNLTYTPTTGYSGADSFTYVATDADATSAAATTSITVTSSGGGGGSSDSGSGGGGGCGATSTLSLLLACCGLMTLRRKQK